MTLGERATRLLGRLVPGAVVEFHAGRLTHDELVVVATAPGRSVSTRIGAAVAHCDKGALPRLANELSLRLRWAL